MVHAEFNTLTFVLVLVLAYFTALLGSWAIHFVQHQKVFGIPLYFPHWRDHHLEVDDPGEWRNRVKSSSHARRTKLWVSLIGHGVWLLLSFGVVLLYFLVFTPWIATVFAAMGLATGAWHYYLHQMSHRAPGDCWLARFRWFERELEFHRVHHFTSSNFGNAANYAFGDPLSKHVIDYLFGTLVEAPAHADGASSARRPAADDVRTAQQGHAV